MADVEHPASNTNDNDRGTDGGLPAELWDTVLSELARSEDPTAVACAHVCRCWRSLLLPRSAPSRDDRRALSAERFGEEAARRGHVSLLRWAHARGWVLGTRVCQAAASAGQLAVLRWEMTRDCRCNPYAMADTAARCGRVSVLRWMRRKGVPFCDRRITLAAAIGGKVRVLRWAKRAGLRFHDLVCEEAAAAGHEAVLRWACRNGFVWTGRGCDRAAQYGRARFLRWAHRHLGDRMPLALVAMLARVYGWSGIAAWADLARAGRSVPESAPGGANVLVRGA